MKATPLVAVDLEGMVVFGLFGGGALLPLQVGDLGGGKVAEGVDVPHQPLPLFLVGHGVPLGLNNFFSLIGHWQVVGGHLLDLPEQVHAVKVTLGTLNLTGKAGHGTVMFEWWVR